MEKYFLFKLSKTLQENPAKSLPNSMHQTLGLKDLFVSSMDENYLSTSKDDTTAQDNCNFEREGIKEKTELTNSREINRGSYAVTEPSDIVVQRPAEDSVEVDEQELSDSDWNGIDIGVQSPVEYSDAVEEQELSDSDWSDKSSTADLQIGPPLFTTDYERSHNNYYIGAGILNLGNTCFLNSVLQCFTHTVPLLSAIISFNHKTPCEDFSQGCFCVLCALCQHIEYSLVAKVVRRVEIADKLDYFSPCFVKYQEEDAHEFLQCFLDKLERCCDDLIRKKDDGTSSSSGLGLKNNIVKEVFGGRIVSSIRCCNCGHCSDTYEPSIDYSLEIDKSVTIYDSLDSFTKIEKIENTETKFICDGCKQSVSVEKRIMLDQVPSVVVFHLKRFKNNGEFFEKIDKFIDFPLKLDLGPYTTTCNRNLKYNLYAILVHIELSSDCGHYYCFIRSTGDIWFKIDDSMVVRVSEDYVLSQNAYLLFYAKQDIPCFFKFFRKLKE